MRETTRTIGFKRTTPSDRPLDGEIFGLYVNEFAKICAKVAKAKCWQPDALVIESICVDFRKDPFEVELQVSEPGTALSGAPSILDLIDARSPAKSEANSMIDLWVKARGSALKSCEEKNGKHVVELEDGRQITIPDKAIFKLAKLQNFAGLLVKLFNKKGLQFIEVIGSPSGGTANRLTEKDLKYFPRPKPKSGTSNPKLQLKESVKDIEAVIASMDFERSEVKQRPWRFVCLKSKGKQIKAGEIIEAFVFDREFFNQMDADMPIRKSDRVTLHIEPAGSLSRPYHRVVSIQLTNV